MNGTLPERLLGRTGRSVTIFGLGGEGVLRTRGRHDEAAAVIERALALGVTYFDTAPAYAMSMDYLGAVIPPHRSGIFLACKTAERSRDGSLRVLEDALRRLRVDSLDLWQIHDVRSFGEVDRVFAPDGAIHALLGAQQQGIVKHLGITGHEDPAIVLEGLRRFDFDTVLVPVNCADKHRMSFLETVVPHAAGRGAGVIAMKVYAGGPLARQGAPASAEMAMRYALSQLGVSTAIIGCRTPAEVEANVRVAQSFSQLTVDEQAALEAAHASPEWEPYKKGELIGLGL